MLWRYNRSNHLIIIEHAAAVAYEKSKPLVIENVEVAPPKASLLLFLSFGMVF
jgi:hypothetical protein